VPEDVEPQNQLGHCRVAFSSRGGKPLFDETKTVDLYRIVKSSTEWPTWDHSIKTLAKFIGFTWRDTNPSGAASIEWYDRFVDTGDRVLLQRILDYNEDDCRAMIVLLDAIRGMAYPKDHPETCLTMSFGGSRVAQLGERATSPST
jgi:hypothetical protein